MNLLTKFLRSLTVYMNIINFYENSSVLLDLRLRPAIRSFQRVRACSSDAFVFVFVSLGFRFFIIIIIFFEVKDSFVLRYIEKSLC